VLLLRLLLFCAIGSAASEKLPAMGWKLAAGVVIAGAVVTAIGVPYLTTATLGLPLAARIAVALAAISPLAIFMGMMYPLGVRLLQKGGVAHLVPWVWAVNGLCGVVASVLGMMVAISFGYTAVLVLGAVAYGATAWAAAGSFGKTS